MVGNFANKCHRGRRSSANEGALHYELNIEERARDTCDEYLGMGKCTWDLGVGATLLRENSQAHWCNRKQQRLSYHEKGGTR